MASSSRVAAFSRRRRSSSAACQACRSTTGGRALAVCSVTVPPGLGSVCTDLSTRHGGGTHRAAQLHRSVVDLLPPTHGGGPGVEDRERLPPRTAGVIAGRPID